MANAGQGPDHSRAPCSFRAFPTQPKPNITRCWKWGASTWVPLFRAIATCSADLLPQNYYVAALNSQKMAKPESTLVESLVAGTLVAVSSVAESLVCLSGTNWSALLSRWDRMQHVYKIVVDVNFERSIFIYHDARL